MRLIALARRPMIVALLALAAGAIAPAAAQASGEVLVTEPFTGTSASSPNWSLPSASSGSNVACLTAGTSTSESPVPGCSSTPIDSPGNGALRLTANAAGQEGGVAYGLSVPTVDGIDATFDSYQYGRNSGADGIGFFLAAADPSDPQPPTSIGQSGGALGYSADAGAGKAGMSFGYLGIGLDVYGNYENTTYEGTGCTDPGWDSSTTFPNNVSVRGPGEGTAGYCLRNSTQTTSGDTMTGHLDGGGSGTRASSVVPVEVVINPSASSVTTASGLSVAPSSYEVAFTPIGGSKQTLSGSLPSVAGFGFPASWYNATSGIPYQLTFGWVGSTGGDMEIHEINQQQSASVTGVPATLTTSVTDDASGAPTGGATFDYDVNVGNEIDTSDDNSTVTVTDTLPSGETPSSTGLGGSGWSCSTAGQKDTCTNNGPLDSGSSLPQLVIPATVTAGAGAQLANSAVASSDDSAPASGADTVTVATPPTDTSTCGAAGGSNGWFIADPSCTVQGTDTSPAIDHVAYQLDSGSVVTTGSGTTTATVPITADGTHTLKTEVLNTSGETSGWATHTIKVDTTAPADTSSCGTPNGQNSYFVTDPTCTVQGADAISGVDHVAYQLDSGSVVTTGSGTTTATVPITADGTHTLKTRIYNVAGLDSGWSTQTIKVLANGPGTPVVNAPANGSVSNDTAPTVSVSGTPGDRATVQVDGVDYGPVTLDGSGDGQVQIAGPLLAGAHTVRAEQTDIAGNVSSWSVTSTWTVKTSTFVQLNGPTAGPTNVTTPTVDYSGEPGDEFTITVDGQIVATGVIPTGGSGSLTLSAALADGSHTIAITVGDQAGNQASASIVVAIDTASPGAPQIVNAPAELTASTSATFSFTDSKTPVSFQCLLDGGAWAACPSPVTFSSLAPGPHTLLVRALDPAGNTSPSTQYAWTIDTTPPPAPTILGGPPADTVPSLAQFQLSAEPGTTLQCSLDGGPFRPCSPVLDLATLPLGAHTLMVRQIDEAGNTSAPAIYHWTVLSRRGPSGLPRTASLLLARDATAAGASALDVGCNLDAGSIRRCHVLAYYHGMQIGRGTQIQARPGHEHTVVMLTLNARGRALLARALGGLPVKLVGRVTPYGFSHLPARTRTLLFAPLRFLLPDVLFDFNSWSLNPQATAIVRGIAAQLRDAKSVVCEGNTDSYGTSAYNYWLGLRRAVTVCTTLRQLAVKARMSEVSYGATRPVDSNATATDRHLNRRVVVRVSYYDLPPGRRRR